MATTGDIPSLEQKLLALEQRFEKRMAELETRVSWRIAAALVFLATVKTLLGVFVD